MQAGLNHCVCRNRCASVGKSDSDSRSRSIGQGIDVHFKAAVFQLESEVTRSGRRQTETCTCEPHVGGSLRERGAHIRANCIESPATHFEGEIPTQIHSPGNRGLEANQINRLLVCTVTKTGKGVGGGIRTDGYRVRVGRTVVETVNCIGGGCAGKI